MNLIADLFLGLGSILLLVAAWGVAQLPDPLARQHAATKAGTSALLCILLGTACALAESRATLILGLIAVILLLTLPLASHLLGRAAARNEATRKRERITP